MGLFDKLRGLFTSDKLNVAERFELVKEAISGTMSKFHVVREHKTGRLLGLKLLDTKKTAAVEERYQGLNKPSEGEIALGLSHPRLVKTLECGLTTEGVQYILMELVPGTGLNTLINQRSPLLEGKGGLLSRQMAEAIAAVHAAGYVHRDICPRNYICDAAVENVTLIDFGLTVPAKKEFMPPGIRTGTPNYMAPEIARRRPWDHRVDLFAWGVTAYQTCTYEHPWPGGDPTGKGALRHDTEPPVDIREVAPKIHPQLAEIIMACLAVDPAERPATATEIVRRLAGAASG